MKMSILHSKTILKKYCKFIYFKNYKSQTKYTWESYERWVVTSVKMSQTHAVEESQAKAVEESKANWGKRSHALKLYLVQWWRELQACVEKIGIDLKYQ